MNEVSHYLRFFIAALFSAGIIYGDLYLSAFDDLRGNMSRVLIPFRAAAALPGDIYNNSANYLAAREKLLSENKNLQQQIATDRVKLKSLDFYIQQNNELRHLLALKKRRQGTWLAAEISRNVSHSSIRRIFLDKGVAHGVIPGITVVDEQGVVGQIIRSDVNVSAVGLLTDPGQWISTRIKRNNLLVILRGDGSSGMAIEYVSDDADIQLGDELLASGGLFPAGYPVGVVESLESGLVYKSGRARLHSDFLVDSFVLLYFADSVDDSETETLQP